MKRRQVGVLNKSITFYCAKERHYVNFTPTPPAFRASFIQLSGFFYCVRDRALSLVQTLNQSRCYVILTTTPLAFRRTVLDRALSWCKVCTNYIDFALRRLFNEEVFYKLLRFSS